MPSAGWAAATRALPTIRISACEYQSGAVPPGLLASVALQEPDDFSKPLRPVSPNS
jgi:hypothetical protein